MTTAIGGNPEWVCDGTGSFSGRGFLSTLASFGKEKDGDFLKVVYYPKTIMDDAGVEYSEVYGEVASFAKTTKQFLGVTKTVKNVQALTSKAADVVSLLVAGEGKKSRGAFKQLSKKTLESVNALKDGSDFIDRNFYELPPEYMSAMKVVNPAAMLIGQGWDAVVTAGKLSKNNPGVLPIERKHNWLVLARTVTYVALGVVSLTNLAGVTAIGSLYLTLLAAKALLWTVCTHFHDQTSGYANLNELRENYKKQAGEKHFAGSGRVGTIVEKELRDAFYDLEKGGYHGHVYKLVEWDEPVRRAEGGAATSAQALEHGDDLCAVSGDDRLYPVLDAALEMNEMDNNVCYAAAVDDSGDDKSTKSETAEEGDVNSSAAKVDDNV